MSKNKKIKQKKEIKHKKIHVNILNLIIIKLNNNIYIIILIY